MRTNISSERVSANVRRLLDGRTLVWLSERTGIPYHHLYRRLRGVAPWTAEQLGALAQAFGVSVDELAAEVAA